MSILVCHTPLSSTNYGQLTLKYFDANLVFSILWNMGLKSTYTSFCSLNKESLLFISLGITLFILVVVQAINVPLTHDEGNTIYCSTTSIVDIVSYKDPVPNNHILNTLFIKLSQSIFGDQLLTNRLHNILLFIPFFLYAVRSSRLLYDDIWVRVALVVTICMQAYVLDFFSVTRGYGVGLAFEMMSIYYLIKRFTSSNIQFSFWSALWGACAVYANFSFLNFFIPLLGLLIFISVFKSSSTREYLIKEVVMIFVIGLLLGAAILVPVSKIVAADELVYWGTDGFFDNTVSSLIASLLYQIDYFNLSGHDVKNLVTIFVFGLLVVGAISNRPFFKNQKLLLTYGLLLSAVLFNILSYWILKIPYLTGRAVLVFIPLFGLSIASALDAIIRFNRKVGLSISIGIVFLCSFHFVKSMDTTVIAEWYYDRDTYNVLDDVQDIVVKEGLTRPAMINCYWIFFPSLEYHIKNDYQSNIKLAPYEVKIDQDTSSMFYYTETGELDKLDGNFKIVKSYNGGNQHLLVKSTSY